MYAYVCLYVCIRVCVYAGDEVTQTCLDGQNNECIDQERNRKIATIEDYPKAYTIIHRTNYINYVGHKKRKSIFAHFSANGKIWSHVKIRGDPVHFSDII